MLTDIRGAAYRLAGGSEDGVGVAATDARTLTVELAHPAAYFTSITATPATFVVPRSATATNDESVDGFVDRALCCGADERRGPRPRRQRSVRRRAAADRRGPLGWPIDGDVATAFSSEQLDLAGIGSFDASWISYDHDLGPSLHAGAALSVQYFAFDTTRKPFDDTRVRQVFALALDRGRLVEQSAGTGALAAGSVVPPALWPSDTFGRPAPADLTAAHRLLAEAGYADGAALGPITVNGTGLKVDPAVAIWRKELGVEINVETMDFSDYLTELRERPPQIYTINWIADYPSPQALYGLLLLPGAPDNDGGWQDATFVDLLRTAAAAEDPSAQATAYGDVEARVREQAPLIPWSYDENWWLVRQGLRGTGQLTIGLLDFGRLSWDG